MRSRYMIFWRPLCFSIIIIIFVGEKGEVFLCIPLEVAEEVGHDGALGSGGGGRKEKEKKRGRMGGRGFLNFELRLPW